MHGELLSSNSLHVMSSYVTIIIIIIASHDDELNDIYNDKCVHEMK